MDDMCTACLCTGRKLYFIGETGHYHLYSQILNEIPVYDFSAVCVRVCWECRAVLRRFGEFKTLVKRSYNELLQHVHQNIPPNKQSLTRPAHLQIQHVMNICYPDTEVKEESEDLEGMTAELEGVIQDIDDMPLQADVEEIPRQQDVKLEAEPTSEKTKKSKKNDLSRQQDDSPQTVSTNGDDQANNNDMVTTPTVSPTPLEDNNTIELTVEESFDNTATQIDPLSLETKETANAVVIEIPSKEVVDEKPQNTSKDDIILSKLNVLLENQEKMKFAIVTLNDRFEEFTKNYQLTSKEVVRKLDFKIIETETEMLEFEAKLKDPVYKADLMKKFGDICGKQRKSGVNVAYKFVDMIFNRNFLKTCSWAGGSRTDDRKVCFRSFKNTIDWFFELVNDCDELFTLTDAETFFKVILRNANKRCSSLNLRASCGRKRMKKMIKNDD